VSLNGQILPSLSQARLGFLARVFLCFSLLFFFAVNVYSQQLVGIPALKARVTDLTGTLSEADKGLLSAKLAELERSKGSQIAVLIVPTTQPETIEQFGLRVAEAWRLGRGKVVAGAAAGKVNDGLLLLVAKDDRKLRIEVGYGLEGAIPDAIAKRVIAETIAPRFKQNDFAGGIGAGVDQLVKLVQGEPLPAPWEAPQSSSGQSGGDDPLEILPLLLFGAIFAIFFLPRMFGRRLGAVVGGGMVGVGSYMVAATPLLLAGGLGVLTFFLVLIFGGLSSGNRVARQIGRSPIVLPGGWGGGGFGGGSGSGGFGGGGGSFGGGGASGDW
jgi:uncharacterized protein